MARRNPLPLLVLCWVPVAFAAGCAWDTPQGRSHLIFGLGVVTVSTVADQPPPHGAVAERIDAAGILLGAGGPVNGLVVGGVTRQSVRVDPAAEILIDAATLADGAFRVNIHPVEPSRSDP